MLAGCAPALSAAPAGSPQLIVAAPDSTATPTPFQPVPPTPLNVPPPLSPTPLPPLPTSTPLPTATMEATSQPSPTFFPTMDPALVATSVAAFDDKQSVNVLLLGSDQSTGAYFRTDTILVAVIWPKSGQVSLISIPRDLWVNIPTVGMQRINTAFEFGEMYGYPGGGPGLLKDTILNNLGIRIDHTARVDFNGFRRIVDTLGGIDVPVACPYTDWRLIDPSYDPDNENNWYQYTAGPGLIHMDGYLALWYARSRQMSNDFDRGRRQQEVLRAIYGQALKTNIIASLPQLWNDFSSTVSTDFNLGDLLKLAPLSLHLNNADIRSYYVNGALVTSWTTPGGAYVLLPNGDAIQAMLQRALSPSDVEPQLAAIKVEVQNGSANDGWDALAAQRLNYAGYQTNIASADNHSHGQTWLYDVTRDQDAARATRLLAVLGLSQSALVSAPGASDKASYILILGNDYQPCFKPDNLAP